MVGLRVSRDIPLSEITLRRYEKPVVKRRELVKKFCLSLGLLQPGDSRDVIVDVLHVLLKAKKNKEEIQSEEIRSRVVDDRKELKLPLLGIASSNIRRQLKRLKDIMVVESITNSYRISEHGALREIFHEKIRGYLLDNIVSRVDEYAKAVDEHFS